MNDAREHAVKPWNATQLKAIFVSQYLPQCQTATERDCCTVYFRRELREFVAGLKRKLTPGECAVLDEYYVEY